MQGRYDGADYAIFQNQANRSSAAENRNDLINELKLLNLAQYFTDSFYERASAYNFRLPST
jgi:hypothetical protein